MLYSAQNQAMPQVTVDLANVFATSTDKLVHCIGARVSRAVDPQMLQL